MKELVRRKGRIKGLEDGESRPPSRAMLLSLSTFDDVKTGLV